MKTERSIERNKREKEEEEEEQCQDKRSGKVLHIIKGDSGCANVYECACSFGKVVFI